MAAFRVRDMRAQLSVSMTTVSRKCLVSLAKKLRFVEAVWEVPPAPAARVVLGLSDPPQSDAVTFCKGIRPAKYASSRRAEFTFRVREFTDHRTARVLQRWWRASWERWVHLGAGSLPIVRLLPKLVAEEQAAIRRVAQARIDAMVVALRQAEALQTGAKIFQRLFFRCVRVIS